MYKCMYDNRQRGYQLLSHRHNIQQSTMSRCRNVKRLVTPHCKPSISAVFIVYNIRNYTKQQGHKATDRQTAVHIE